MTEVQTQTVGAKSKTALVIAAVVLIGGVVFGAVQLSGGNESTAPSGGTTQDQGDNMEPQKIGLSEQMGGQAAIDELGDSLEGVAARNDMTVDELKDLLLTNPSAQITKTGNIIFVDPGPKN